MVQARMLDGKGVEVKKVDLAAVFEEPVRRDLIHRVVVAQLANKRQGTHAVKSRSMVAGGGRKPWRQKGTGRARQGSTRAVQWVGGGVAFGPQSRDHGLTVPKKIRKSAIMSALSARAAEGKISVVDNFGVSEKPSTKTVAGFLKKAGIERTCLIVLGSRDENIMLSSRNIPGVKVINVASLNVYDLVRHQDLVVTTEALNKISEVWS